MKLNSEQYTRRLNSILTNGEIEEISSIKNFPVFIGVTDQNIELDLFHDLTFDICKDTGIIQLRDCIDQNIIYSEFHCEAIGDIWNTHHDKFSDIISKYSKNKNILEIGGSDSRIALKTLDKDNDIKKWTIIEPAIKYKIQNDRLFYIEDFFNEKYYNEDFDLVVHSHTLEHMYNPKEFLKDISNSLNNGDYHIFSFPNLYKYLKNGYSNVINFEHTLYLTEEIIDYLINLYDFEIVEKQYYDEHSIFYVTRKNDKIIKKELENNYEIYKKDYDNYFNYFKKFVLELNEKIEKTENDVYLFGAHVFSQYLIFHGLKTDKIKYILDNSKLKLDKRLYGTNLFIKSPNSVNIKNNSIVILKVGQYKEEIKNQLININSTIEFFE